MERKLWPEIKGLITANELHDILVNHVGIGAQTVALNKLLASKQDG